MGCDEPEVVSPFTFASKIFKLSAVGIPEPETTALAPAVNSARQLQQDDATGQADSLWHAVQQAISIAGPESIKAPGVRTNARDWVLQGESLDRCGEATLYAENANLARLACCIDASWVHLAVGLNTFGHPVSSFIFNHLLQHDVNGSGERTNQDCLID